MILTFLCSFSSKMCLKREQRDNHKLPFLRNTDLGCSRIYDLGHLRMSRNHFVAIHHDCLNDDSLPQQPISDYIVLINTIYITLISAYD